MTNKDIEDKILPMLELLYSTACQDMSGVLANRKGYELRGDTVPKAFAKEIAKEFSQVENKARLDELKAVIKRNYYGMTKSQLGTLDRIATLQGDK